MQPDPKIVGCCGATVGVGWWGERGEGRASGHPMILHSVKALQWQYSCTTCVLLLGVTLLDMLKGCTRTQ